MSWIRKVKITQNRRGGLKYGSFLKALDSHAGYLDYGAVQLLT